MLFETTDLITHAKAPNFAAIEGPCDLYLTVSP